MTPNELKLFSDNRALWDTNKELEATNEKLRQRITELERMIRSHVYIVEMEDGLLKIGFTTRLLQRMKTLQPVRMLGLQLGSPSVEKKLLRRFKPYLARPNEYFHPVDEIFKYADSLELCPPQDHWQKQLFKDLHYGL